MYRLFTFRKKLVGLLFLAGAFLPTIYCQDTTRMKTADKLFNLSLDEFLDVVITPSKSAQSVNNVTQKVDVISAKDIESIVSGNRNICEVISKLPGVSVSVLSRNDANWGTYGGIGPKYSTYMLQGLPVDAFVDPMSLDLNAIDHIEVQRGPASVIYPNFLSQDFAGSQSPLAGTVNLILKGKVEQQLNSFLTSLGSYNTLNSQFYHQDKIDRVNYFFGSTFETSDYTNYGTEGSWLNMKKNPEYRKTKIYAGLTIFMDKEEKQKLTLYGQETLHTGDAGRVYKGYDNKYGTMNIGYDIALNDRINLQSHVGMRLYDRSWQESNFGVIDTLKSDNGVNQLIIPVDISLTILHGEGSSLTVGADFQKAKYSTWNDPLAGRHIYGNISAAMQRGIYMQEEWRPVSRLTLRGGMRFAVINNTLVLEAINTPDDNELSWQKLLWSTGVKYVVNDRISIYINSGSSFSTPGLKSVGGTILLSDLGVPGKNGQLPNPDLKPETGIGTDAGIDFNFPENFRLGIRGFYTVLQDGIVDNVVSQNPSQTQSINTKTAAGGAEIEISHKISSVLTWYANGTYMKTVVKNELNSDQNNAEIPFSPNLVLNAGLNLNTRSGLILSPSVNYNGGFYDGISKLDRIKYKPGVVLNTYISQQVVKNNSYMLDFFLQLYNITNNKYSMPWQFKNPGISWTTGLKLNF
jgi:iron complex outermembrane recepter protein